MRGKTYEELGKTSFTIAVAFLVFTMIKPFSEGSFDIATVFVGFGMFLALICIGIYLINKGGSYES